jgi:hypothetical protein
LLQHRLLVFDVGFNRIPRASFPRSLVRRGHNAVTDEDSVGKPAKVDILFCRDPIDEADHPENYTTHPGSHTTHAKSYATPFRQPLSLGQFIKLMIVYKLYGLNDIAVDTLERFANRLKGRLDTEHAIRLLADPPLPAGFAAAVRPQRPAVGAAADAGSARSGGIGLSFRLPGSAGV